MDEEMSLDDLVVLVGTSIADGESCVVPDTEFLKLMFERAPERERLFNPNNFNVEGYASFTQALSAGDFGVRLEDIQKGINERWACWDDDAGCFDTSQCPGVIDSYAFVNANSLLPAAFGRDVFENEEPADTDRLYAMDRERCSASWERTGAKALSADSSTERKPWLL